MTDHWIISDHCCRHCLGRILEREGAFACSGCGAKAVDVNAICGCGIVLGEGSLRGRRLFRCTPNPQRSPTCPAEIVIAVGELPSVAAASPLPPALGSAGQVERAEARF
jgi:hypothetical protein